MEKPIRIITHSGSFHADELLAIAALDCLLDGKSYEVIRTRDNEFFLTGDYVVDVGGLYDPSTNRFDHHQEGGAGARENGIPYSSFGLVWKHYGEAICGSKEVANAIDKSIGYPIDMGDNGVDYYSRIRPDTEPLILQSFVAMFRPTWKSEASDDERFMELLPMMKRFLSLAIAEERDRLEASSIVRDAYAQTDDKRIIVLDGSYPWEEVLANYPEPLFVVKPRGQDDAWAVGCVRDVGAGFTNRKDLPTAWAGKRDAALAEVSGVPDALFCHNRLFIAVAKTKEGAIRLAELARDA